MLRMLRIRALGACAAACLLVASATGAPQATGATASATNDAGIESAAALDLSAVSFRSIGPTTMGGRIIDLAIDPTRSRIFYAASASGGLFKTTNSGVSFRPVFDQHGSSSVGAVAVSTTKPDTVWVGTGEANPRNSVSWGDGVYVSRDGGETWDHAGLRDSRHIAAIVVDPTRDDRIFVAAMGHTWGKNPTRGLYRSENGGATWENVLYVDDETGCIDVLLDPVDPSIVYAATWQRARGELDDDDPQVKTGAGSGLWKSRDGGTTWKRLRDGLPTHPMGRVGMDVYLSDPRVLYAVIETDLTGNAPGAPVRSEDKASIGVRGKNHERGFEVVGVTSGGPAELAGVRPGDVITRIGDAFIEDAASLGLAVTGYRPGEQVDIAFLHVGEETVVRAELVGRVVSAGGQDLSTGMQGGQVANAQGSQGKDGVETGGVFRSSDRGESWQRVNSLNPRPFYYSQVRVDPSDDRNVYVLGISVHGSTDGGETFDTRVGIGTHPDHHALWIDPQNSDHLILGNDGGVYQSFDRCASWDSLNIVPLAQFYAIAADNERPYRVYGGLQDNGTWMGPSAVRRSSGIQPEDWVTLNGGDGFVCAVDPGDDDIVYCESQNGFIARINTATGSRSAVAKPEGPEHRYNWRTPMVIPEREPGALLFAGTVLCRTIDQGRTYRAISPSLPLTDKGSATAIAVSPIDERAIAVGTDDGALWITKNGGETWEEIHARLGFDRPIFVADLCFSHHDPKKLFVVLDAHRQNDPKPHLRVTEDLGQTFRTLDEGLPRDGSVRAIIGDRERDGLLLVGTERGCFVSLDDGKTWLPLRGGQGGQGSLPTVPVHGLLIHPRDTELVLGTHGRGVYIADAWPLRHLTDDLQKAGQGLLPVNQSVRWRGAFEGSEYGARRFKGQNPAPGAAIWYLLGQDAPDRVTLEIKNAAGEAVASVRGRGGAGLHRANWNLSITARGNGGGRGLGGGRGGRTATPGTYTVTLSLGDQSFTEVLELLDDPVGR